MNEMNESTLLDVLKSARVLVAANWCAFYLDHPDGVRHCAFGAVRLITDRWRQEPWEALNAAAVALYPELRGRVEPREECYNLTCSWDQFDVSPTIFINNHLGRDAALRVFDAAILDLELKLAGAAVEPASESAVESESECAGALVR